MQLFVPETSAKKKTFNQEVFFFVCIYEGFKKVLRKEENINQNVF